MWLRTVLLEIAELGNSKNVAKLTTEISETLGLDIQGLVSVSKIVHILVSVSTIRSFLRTESLI